MATRIEAHVETSAKLSAERAGRLYRLVQLLAAGDLPRAQLTKRLKVGTRTCYRDIDVLRDNGVAVETIAGGYGLGESLDEALAKVPFPDPELTFGDVITLMRGRTAAHKRLQKLMAEMSN